jgi:TonB family protein
MSDTLVNEGTGGTPPERRVYARLSLSALAYLDIGSDNGGIVVNISEGGLEVQAVNPLGHRLSLKLRIQPPGSQSRIETEARIAWLGGGQKQAGLCFLGMPADVRVQVREWIRSEGAPSAPQVPNAAENENPPLANAAEPIEKQECSTGRADKWLTILAELEESSVARPVETPVRDSEQLRGWVRIAPPKPELASGSSGERANRSRGGSRFTEVPPGSPVYHQSEPSTKIEQAHASDAGNRGSANSDLNVGPSTRPVLVRSSLQGTRTAPGRTSSPQIPAEHPSTVAQPDSESSKLSTGLKLPTENPPATRRKNWGRIAALLMLLATVSFGVGIQVGRRGHRTDPSASAAIQPRNALSVSKLSTKASVENKSTESATLAVEPQHRREAPPARLRAKTTTLWRNHAPVETLPGVVAVAQNLETAPEEIPPAPRAAKPLRSTPSSPAPAIDQAAAEGSRPTIIDGHVLRPIDRFNPCHLTYRVDPVYPLQAERQRIQGAVRIHQVIGPDGSVQSVKLLSGPAPLVPAAMDAARYWRYLPALLNGEPVATEQDVEIDFRLPESE